MAPEDLMLELAALRPGERVLDLCFGRSRLLDRAVACGLPDVAITALCAERLRCLAGLLRLRLAGLERFERVRIILSDPLCSAGTASALAENFDCVLVDPQWGRRLTQEQKSRLGITTPFAENALLQVALSALHPNGRVVLLTSDGLLFREAVVRRAAPRDRVRFAELPQWAALGRSERDTAGRVVHALRGREPRGEFWREVEREMLARLEHSLLPEQWFGISGPRPSIVKALAAYGVPLRPLPEVAEFLSGVNPKPDEKMDRGASPGLFCVGMLRITELRGGQIGAPAVFLTERASAKVSPDKYLRRGDLLVSMSRRRSRSAWRRPSCARGRGARRSRRRFSCRCRSRPNRWRGGRSSSCSAVVCGSRGSPWRMWPARLQPRARGPSRARVGPRTRRPACVARVLGG